MERIGRDEVPYLTTSQMREVDRIMVEDFGIKLLQMMENAGRCLAQVARERFLDGDPRGKNVVVLAGTGGNGGGALVAARRLQGWGAHVSAALTRPAGDFRGVPARQLGILQRMSVPIVAQPGACELIVDGIIGYSLRGTPRGTYAERIEWANEQDAAILALDTPSGVDATDGTVHDPAIRATATMTLALPKEGLRAASTRDNVGELFLADIGVPPGLYSRIGLEVPPIFAHGDIVRLD